MDVVAASGPVTPESQSPLTAGLFLRLSDLRESGAIEQESQSPLTAGLFLLAVTAGTTALLLFMSQSPLTAGLFLRRNVGRGMDQERESRNPL